VTDHAREIDFDPVGSAVAAAGLTATACNQIANLASPSTGARAAKIAVASPAAPAPMTRTLTGW